jgi:2-methylisocitrate lyase-like PEP mutase family enzyme
LDWIEMLTFRELHGGAVPFVLPNAWDLGSALAFTTAGFPAVGTTSFGIPASAGVPDGSRGSKAATESLAVQLYRLPAHITLDIEDGYSDDAAEVAEFVAGLEAVGVAGINIEDSVDGHLIDSVDFAKKVEAVRHRCPNLFVNARVDNLWFGEQATVEAVLLRATAYAAAGADGIFVPGLAKPEDIQRITGGLNLPVNVLAHPTLTVSELGRLGVRRVSLGSLAYRAAIDAAVAVATALREDEPLKPATSYWEMQSRLEAFNRNIAV